MGEPTRFKIGHGLMGIWFYDKGISQDILRQMKIYLDKNFHYSQMFNEKKDLANYLSNQIFVTGIVFIFTVNDKKEKIAMEKLVRRRKQFNKLYRIEIESDTSMRKPNMKQLRELLENSFKTINEDLQRHQEQIVSVEIDSDANNDDQSEPISLVDTFKSSSTPNSFYDLNSQSLRFLLCQSLIGILIHRTYDQTHFDSMWALCRRHTLDNPTELNKIQQLAANYGALRAINYYTKDACLFRLISQAFRLEDVDSISLFGCYLADLYQQLDQVGNNQRLANIGTQILYRGKQLLKSVVQQFQDNVGHLISLNGLLSTSTDNTTAEFFASLGQTRKGYQPVIFEMHIDSSEIAQLATPHANIQHLSDFPAEMEVLFFVGFIWKIESIESIGGNYWCITLKSCTDYDGELITYIKKPRQDDSYLRTANIFRELGDRANADNFYERMLEDKEISNETRSEVLFQQGMLADDHGEYKRALKYLQEADKLMKETTTTQSTTQNIPLKPLFADKVLTSKLSVLSNLGLFYWKDANYPSATEYFERALNESGPRVEQAVMLNNYGLLEFEQGHFQKAAQLFEQARLLLSNADALISEVKENILRAQRMIPG